MKWIKVNIPEFQEQSYVDIDKAFRFSIYKIKVESKIKYRVRAYFLVNQSINKTTAHYPIFTPLGEFNTEKEAKAYIEKLMGSFLEKEGG